jgi:hypothetical protein
MSLPPPTGMGTWPPNEKILLAYFNLMHSTTFFRRVRQRGNVLFFVGPCEGPGVGRIGMMRNIFRPLKSTKTSEITRTVRDPGR